MAIRAIRGSKAGTRSRVNRIVGLLPPGEVASGVAAIGRSNLQIVIVVEVAGGARNIGVSIREKKTGGAMVKNSRVPTHGVVARGAIGRGKGRAGRRMRRVVRFLPVS